VPANRVKIFGERNTHKGPLEDDRDYYGKERWRTR